MLGGIQYTTMGVFDIRGGRWAVFGIGGRGLLKGLNRWDEGRWGIGNNVGS